MTLQTLNSRSRKTLASLARRRGVARWHDMTKAELVRALFRLSKSAPITAAERSSASQQEEGPRRHSAGQPPERRTPLATANGKPGDRAAGSGRNRLAGTEPIPKMLPDRASQLAANALELTAVDAQWLRATWDLSRDSILRAAARLGSDWHRAVPVLRLFAVAADHSGTVSDRFLRDVPIAEGTDTWFVHVPGRSRTYRVHVGYRSEKGVFVAVCKSNPCAPPVCRVVKSTLSPPSAKGAERPEGDRREETPRRSTRDSAEDLGRPLGFSSLTHFGPAASRERLTCEFRLELATELIVHGCTRPGAQLRVQGEPVAIREDGSFTVRIVQPEGRQVLSFAATSPSGSECRVMILGMERNTKEMERQVFDGMHAEESPQ
ncbi:MAG: DUF4912 domain-containing protein [Planctomycetales bacterium]